MDLKEIIVNNLANKTKEIKRVFHGRGNFYEKYNFLTVDSLDYILFATFFDEDEQEEYLIELLKSIALEFNYKVFVVQRRYKNDDFNEIIFGELPNEVDVVENNLKFSISFKNQNIGLFFDMKKGREYLKSICENKSVLNLFSYTCAFSVYAKSGNALKIVNVDMAKNALNIGRLNHRINNLDTKDIKFLPHNILKSWGKLKKEGPYDVIVIDPPSFQKGSFAATKDYEKIVKRLDEMTCDESTIISCLNAPELDTTFMINLFNEFAPQFKFEKRLENLEEFTAIDDERSLKILIFKKEKLCS